MTEEKPLPEQSDSTEPTEEAAASAATPANETDSIMAALSALSNAAAPVRDDDAAGAAIPAPETANVVFEPAPEPEPTPEPADAQTPPPPPPPPDSVDFHPAPVGAPIAVSTAPIAIVPPAPAAKKKRWPWILALCIAAGVLLLVSMFACVSAAMNAAFHTIQHNERQYGYGDLTNPYFNDGLLNYYYSGTAATFDELLDYFNIDEGEVTANGVYAHGAYHVGGENGIAPGLYYLEGSQNGVSNFYVFHATTHLEDPDYRLTTSIEYFGNYYAELEGDDVIIFAPVNANSTMTLASDKPMDVIPPYKSGCYRVGIDIPAGTYTITCDAEAARETESEAGAYVMQDLEFGEESIVESVFVIKGGRQTITVENGQYLELFATIATPATASTKVPLQHIESEHPHVA